MLCDSISIHEAKGERDKTSQRARQGIKLEAVFHSGPRVRGGFVLPLSDKSVSLRFFFFFFCMHLHNICICIAGAYPVWHPHLYPVPVHILQGRRTAVNEKTPRAKKSASCALRVFGHPPALILSLTETAHLQYRLRSCGPGTWWSLPPPIFTRTRIRLTGYGEGFPLWQTDQFRDLPTYHLLWGRTHRHTRTRTRSTSSLPKGTPGHYRLPLLLIFISSRASFPPLLPFQPFCVHTHSAQPRK